MGEPMIPTFTMGQRPLDFSPITNALAAYQQQQNWLAQQDFQRQQFAEGQRQFGLTNALARDQYGLQARRLANEEKMIPLEIEKARAGIAHANASEARASQLFPTQLSAAQTELGLKRREMEMPQGKLTELDPNKRLIYTDPRTGTPRVIVDAAGSNSGPFKDAKQKADVEEGLRKEFAALSKPHFEVRDAYARVEQAAARPSAAGDLALIFNFMKMLDPGSVVREGEFATAQTAGSIPDRVWGLYNRIVQGERLSEPIRADFVAQANGLYARSAAQYQNIQRQYHAITSRTGADPQNTIIDFGPPGGVSSSGHGGAVRSFDDVGQIPEGAKFKDEQTGTIYQKRNGQIVTVP